MLKTILASVMIFSLPAQSKDLSLAETLIGPAYPIQLTTQLKSNMVTELIDAKIGGQVVLKSISGTQYMLTLPAGSLPYSQHISLTEIENLQINTEPATSSVQGVQIYPNGVQLIVPATLEIKSTKAFDKNSFVILTSNNDGSLGHIPTLKSFKTSSVEFSLMHFSNYLTSDDRKVQDIIDIGQSELQSTRIWNWLGKKIKRMIESQGQSEEFNKDYLDSLKEFANAVLIPDLIHAQTCETGHAALNEYFLLSRQAAIMGIDLDQVLGADAATAFQDSISLTLPLCMQEAREYCHHQHQILPALRIYLQVGRFAGLLGDEKLHEAVESAANKCMSFKFFSQSEFWMGEERIDSHGLQTLSEFDFNFNLGGVIMTAAGFLNANGTVDRLYNLREGPLEIADVSMRLDPMTCRRDSFISKPGVIKVDNFIGDLLAGRDMKMRLDGMNAEFNSKFTCWDPGDKDSEITMELPPYGAEKYFQGLFHAAHGPTGLNEMNKEGYWVLSTAAFRNSSKFAEAVYNHVVEDVVHETSTFIIYHTPQD